MSTDSTLARRDRALWVQCACTALVALGAAYTSYRHGRDFAARFGADPTTAAIWPLIVDGLLTTATVELWRSGRGGGSWSAWLAFLFGVVLSLCGNIAAAPELSVFAVTVAACPPLALLLAMELLIRAVRRHSTDAVFETDDETAESDTETGEISETDDETDPVVRLAAVPNDSPPVEPPTAEQRMWAYYQSQRARGRTPSGAELDRVAGTNNYGRRVLRRWQRSPLPPVRPPKTGLKPLYVAAATATGSSGSTSGNGSGWV